MTTAVPQGSKRYSGSRVHRVEDARLLTGEGVFVDDVMLPGMLHVAFTRSPYARALILGIDTTEAAALPGVHRVLVAEDLNPGVHELWYTIIGRVRKDTPRPPLAEGQARFVGDPVAMVIAENRYIAEDAADLVAVEYQPLPPVVDYLQAEESPDLVHESHGSNVIGGLSGPPPEAVDDVLESVPFLLTETMYQQAQSPCPMEGRGLIVHRQVATGDVTIYAAHAVSPRVEGVLCPVGGNPRASGARHYAGHGRRVWSEDHCAAGGHVRDAGRDEGVGAAEVDRGSPGEPHVGRAVPT